MDNTDKIVELLQDAFQKDPEAIKSLILHRVPANDALADETEIVVNENQQVGALGLINAILTTLGTSKIAIVFNEAKEFVGFTNYGKL